MSSIFRKREEGIKSVWIFATEIGKEKGEQKKKMWWFLRLIRPPRGGLPLFVKCILYVSMYIEHAFVFNMFVLFYSGERIGDRVWAFGDHYIVCIKWYDCMVLA